MHRFRHASAGETRRAVGHHCGMTDEPTEIGTIDAFKCLQRATPALQRR